MDSTKFTDIRNRIVQNLLRALNTICETYAENNKKKKSLITFVTYVGNKNKRKKKKDHEIYHNFFLYKVKLCKNRSFILSRQMVQNKHNTELKLKNELKSNQQ